MVVILSEVIASPEGKDLLLILDSPQPEILRRYAPQDDKEGAIPSEAGSMLVILNEVIASPEGKDLLLILENLKTEILRPKTGLRMTNKGKRSLRSFGMTKRNRSSG